jgi:hypothetical protein
MSFKKCPHTCSHVSTGRSGKTARQSNYIFYTPGASFKDHMSSNLHPHCSPSCVAHPQNPNQQSFSVPTDQDWKEVADIIYHRFHKNPTAKALIPIQYLAQNTPPTSQIPDPTTPIHQETIQENDQPSQNNGDHTTQEQEEAVFQVHWESRQNHSPEQDTPPSFTHVHRQLVDRGVSPIQIPTEPPSSHLTKPPPSSSVPKPLHDFTTTWIDPTHFNGTPFYTDPLQVVFVHLPFHHTSITKDSGMCTNLSINHKWKQIFLNKFPKSAFTYPEQQFKFLVWEWVSYKVVTKQPFSQTTPISLGLFMHWLNTLVMHAPLKLLVGKITRKHYRTTTLIHGEHCGMPIL